MLKQIKKNWTLLAVTVSLSSCAHSPSPILDIQPGIISFQSQAVLVPGATIEGDQKILFENADGMLCVAPSEWARIRKALGRAEDGMGL